jgi:hypothetical protein
MQLAQDLVPSDTFISAALLENVLAPYKPHCRYLKRARVVLGADQVGVPTSKGTGINAHGEFAIPESCYISDTGHFNAVEYNICYNQLAYALLAVCVQHKWLPALAHWTLDDYRRRQLPDILIVDFSSEFRAPMESRRFEGFVGIGKVATRRGTVFMKTCSQFRDGNGGLSRGRALLAVVNGANGAGPSEAVTCAGAA